LTRNAVRVAWPTDDQRRVRDLSQLASVSPKKNWKRDEMRGALDVILPIEQYARASARR
jgi:hypothetical protein